jgi:hypothetical protein
LELKLQDQMSEPTDKGQWTRAERYLPSEGQEATREHPRSRARKRRKRRLDKAADERPDLFDRLEDAALAVPYWRRLARALETLLIRIAARLRQ